MKRLIPFVVALGLPSAALAVPVGDESTVSRAITPQVVDAVAQELVRSLSLTVRDALKPYFVGYKLTEVEVNDVTASLGATTVQRDRHFVLLESHVHVGTYQFDNSNFVAAGRDEIDGIANTTLPLEATPELAARAAWLATDGSYKEALEQIRAKQDALRTGASGGATDVPSYTAAEPIISPEPVLVPKLEDVEHLRKRSEKISGVLRDHKHIRDSRVSFTSFLERRWYINSEGSKAHDTRRVSGVIIVVGGQADKDGQELNLYYSRYGTTEKDLPSDDELIGEAKRLSATLDKLQKAPILEEEYVGPILFEGEGAAGMIRYTLSRHLSGTPLPVGLSDQDAKRFGGELVNLVGRRVLSPILSVIDDPTESRWQKQRLIGNYKFDDEGVKAQRVQVIKDGKLEQLLMSRTPSKKTQKSNGHARLSMPGGVFRGSTTNLVVSAKGGKPRKALVKDLLARVRAEGLPYGIIIRQFDDAALTANPDMSRLELIQLLRSLDQDAPPISTVAYRVYPNGREELIRGAQLKPIALDKWGDVGGASKELTVTNFLASTDDDALFRLRGGDEGFVPSAGIESSIVSPDLLFKKLTIKPSAAGLRPFPAIPSP